MDLSIVAYNYYSRIIFLKIKKAFLKMSLIKAFYIILDVLWSDLHI